MDPGQEAGGGAPKTFTEEELNKLIEDRLNRDRKKSQEEKAQLVKQLEALKTSGMSAEERQAFETQIEVLKNETLTKEELAAKAKAKLEKDYQMKLEAATAAAGEWQSQYTDMRINHAIDSEANSHEVLPQSKKFALAILKPLTRLVPVVDADGKPVPGAFMEKVKFPSKDKEGKPVTLDISISEAFKQMKDTPEEYGTLFKAPTSGGLGGSTSGGANKKVDIGGMSMDEYMALRKTNPAAVEL